MSARQVTIRHTHADGTLVEGTTRADRDLHQVIQAHGLRFARTLARWYLPHSRDTDADQQRISGLAGALRAAGVAVKVVVDDTPRGAADRERDRHERLEERRERLEARADRLGDKADGYYGRGHQMLDAIPLGQPMLPGHHSYGRDRNYRERARKTIDRAFTLAGESESAAQRAKNSRAAEAHRMSGPATMGRIDKLEADRRRILRGLEGAVEADVEVHERPDDPVTGARRTSSTVEGFKLIPPSEADAGRLRGHLARVDDALAFWRAHLEQLTVSGRFAQYGPADFKKGDRVCVRGRAATVLRVNKKSLTVHSDGLPAVFDGPVGYDEVRPLPEGGDAA